MNLGTPLSINEQYWSNSRYSWEVINTMAITYTKPNKDTPIFRTLATHSGWEWFSAPLLVEIRLIDFIKRIGKIKLD